MDKLNEAAIEGGPACLKSDLDQLRVLMLLGDLPQELDGPIEHSAYYAFQAIAVCVAAAEEELLAKGIQDRDAISLAKNHSQLTMKIPIWAAVMIQHGWMAATVPSNEDGQRMAGPLPFLTAFNLGGNQGDRTVAKKHANRRRDWMLARRIACLRARDPSLTLHAIFTTDDGPGETACRRAWEAFGPKAEEWARTVLPPPKSGSQ